MGAGAIASGAELFSQRTDNDRSWLMGLLDIRKKYRVAMNNIVIGMAGS